MEKPINKIRISIALLFILLIIPNFGLAQDSLSFKKCIEIGLEQNLSLKIIRNYELMSRYNLSYGLANFLPSADAKGNLSYSVINSRQQRFSGEIQEKENARSNALSSSINLNWTIFDGFAMFVNYSRLQEISKLGELNTRLNVENLIARLGLEYFGYYQKKKRLQTLQYVLVLSKERLRVSEEKYQIGSISRLDYQQDRIEYNADSSIYLRQMEAVESARLSLTNAMALPVDSSINISDSIIVDYSLIYSDLYQETLKSNAALLIVDKNKILSEKDLQLINSQFFPTLFLTGGYTYNKSESQAGIILENKQYGLNYGVGFTYPVFNHFDVHRQRKIAKLNIENAVYIRKQAELDIISDLNIIYNAYRNNIKILELEKQNLETAHNNFVIAQERYRLGNLAGIEMREIQRMYLDAEDRLLNAQYQAKLAEISLKQISGRIEEYL